MRSAQKVLRNETFVLILFRGGMKNDQKIQGI